MKLKEIENRFKTIQGLPEDYDLTQYPTTEEAKLVRREENKTLGEVFTPPMLIDEMIQKVDIDPTKRVLDLCAGRGNFGIRILRKIANTHGELVAMMFLKEKLWFNEYNLENCKDILEIFGDDINLLCGDGREISKAKDRKGIQIWNGEEWLVTTADSVRQSINYPEAGKLKRLF